MPKYAELALQSLAILDRLDQIINSEILVVLCDNFNRLIFKQYEVFDIVNQISFR